jgi:hypothetical protein
MLNQSQRSARLLTIIKFFQCSRGEFRSITGRAVHRWGPAATEEESSPNLRQNRHPQLISAIMGDESRTLLSDQTPAHRASTKLIRDIAQRMQFPFAERSDLGFLLQTGSTEF